MVNKVVGYLESSEDNMAFGLGLTAAVLCCEVLRAMSFSTLMIFAAQTGKQMTQTMQFNDVYKRLYYSIKLHDDQYH